jgi:DNA repair photolyase
MQFDAGRDFDERIFAKVNVAEALRRDLGKKSWARETVALGTASDPYQPAEGCYRLTRACLETLAEFRTPGNVTTKGTLVVRDVDVLQQLGACAGSGVSFSLITLDERVWRAIEPGTPHPRQRLRAMERLASAGVGCGIALAPILPGLTDAASQLEAVVAAAAEHGAQWLWSGTLHLEPAVRDWFLQSLERHFPASVAAYARTFGARGAAGGVRYAPKAYADALQRQVGELKTLYGLAERRRPAPKLPRPSSGPDRAASGVNIPDYPLPEPLASAPVSGQLALPL